MNWLVTVILFLPLFGGIISFYSGKKTGLIASISTLCTFLLAIFLLLSNYSFIVLLEWLPGYHLSIKIDSVSLLLISLVTLISTLVNVFSIEYMRSDLGKNRYFAKIGFFTFSMIGLLLADHLILMFVFWELVGFASYLLIGFWYGKEGVPQSARLAFIVNRLADVGFLAGILILNQGSLSISEFQETWLFIPSILISIGAFGKSAQLPFSGWLTKAMVGPTPVSALIHAATMVAAGVYLLFRIAPYLHPDALIIIAFIGTATALYGGISALMQHDIKKVLAYSTISQLGYMILGVGVGAPETSIFHLFTHAFFKAGLFLGAGSIIHFMHKMNIEDEQDMRTMGGLRKFIPWTYRSFLVCALALAGIPFLSGFMSKEGIVIAAWEWASINGTWAYLVPDIALITAFLTALYVGRMVLLVFWGKVRFETKVDVPLESSQFKLPLGILAAGSLWVLYNLNPLAHGSWLDSIWGVGEAHADELTTLMVTFLSLLLAFSGLILAYSFFKPNSNYAKSYGLKSSDRFTTILNGFYLTEFYQIFGRGVEKAAEGTFQIDKGFIDRSLNLFAIGGVVLAKVIALIDRFFIDGPINLMAYLSGLVGKLLAAISSRDLQTQLAWLLLGIILILSLILIF